MKFKKGQSGNPNGRPKNAPNKINKELRGVIKDLLEGQDEKVKKELESLSGKDYLEIYIRLAGLVLPKIQTISSDVSLEVSPKLPSNDLSKLDDTELKKLELLIEKTATDGNATT